MKKANRNATSFALGTIALVAIAAAAPANSANAAVIFSSVDQSGFGFGVDPASGMFIGLQSGGAYPLTAAAGFDFAAQDYASLTTIDKLTISLTINDGDSDVGEFDSGDLTLALDGIDTGLKLNGFPNLALLTLDIEATTTATAAALLAALQSDGRLVATVVDPDADGITQQNSDFIGFPATQLTTLVIEGQSGVIPLPAAALMAPLAAALFTTTARRFRRAK